MIVLGQLEPLDPVTNWPVEDLYLETNYPCHGMVPIWSRTDSTEHSEVNPRTDTICNCAEHVRAQKQNSGPH